ncbi:MAG TPA: phosphotransferase [Dermatophilaceae bacterium]|nr:phosphotransferase [Dermatophilaceae bacterium]
MDGAPRGLVNWLLRAFGLPGPGELTAAARGAMGRVWRLSGPFGQRAAKELFGAPPAPEQVAAELAFAQRCRAVGVPSPAALPGADGSTLQVDPASGRTWRLFEWVDAAMPARDDAATSVWLAGCLARMHRVAPPATTPVDPWYRQVTADWPRLADAALEQGVTWGPALARRTPELMELAARVNAAPEEPALFAHCDVNLTNVLLAADGRRWLVDWDNCGPMAPAQEIGRLFQDHYRDDVVVRGLAAAYRQADGPADLRGEHVMVAAQAIWLNYLAEQVTLLLQPDVDPSHARHAEDGLVLLHQMPSPGQLEHTLRVLRASG